MAKQVWIYPYNRFSEGARRLANGLGILRIKHGPESTFKGGPNHIVINWGSGDLPNAVRDSIVLNTEDFAMRCMNKLRFFRTLSAYNEEHPKVRVRIPYWTTSQKEAKSIIAEGYSVVMRAFTEGKDGEGLTVAHKALDLRPVPLYTTYIENTDEYRVHVIDGKVVDVLLREPGTDTKKGEVIRVSSNGFLMSRDFEKVPDDVAEQAVRCFRALGKGGAFIGVDIIYDAKSNKAIVLEANSAPEMLPLTVKKYVPALKAMIEKMG